MMRRMRRSRSGTRRKSRWEGGFAYLTALSGAPTTVPTVANSSSVSAVWARVPAGVYDTVNAEMVLDDCTVYRMIHSANFSLVSSGVGGLDITVGMGVIAWDGISDVPPVITDVPFPVQSGGADWLWWWVTPMFSASVPANSGLSVYNLNAPESFSFTKSQRKLSTNTGLLLVAEVYANVNGLAWNYGFDYNGRYAFKLP